MHARPTNGERRSFELYGSRVTITDSTAPALGGAHRRRQGLLAPGIRSGDEPVTFSATDNVGIRRAEIVDVTDAANPAVVASEDYTATATAPERALRLHQAAPVPRPQERDDRGLTGDRRQARRCCCASPTRPATRRCRRPSPSRRAARSTARAEATARAWSPASPATPSAAAARRARGSASCARPRRSAGATAPSSRGCCATPPASRWRAPSCGCSCASCASARATSTAAR